MASDQPTHATVSEDEFAEVWRANRPYLVNLAYGMLGDIGAAEDAAQEAFARYADADSAKIKDPRAWLIVVTSRVCLDQIGSARVRRERASDPSTIEVTGRPTGQLDPVDPADRVTLDDEVKGALFVVLERLTPAERVVFVLHDVFATPFDSIAETVGRPVATCRQLARRARLKIGAEAPRLAGEVHAAEHRLLAERFIQACAFGDVSALVPLLDPQVWGDVDMGPGDPRTGVTNHGAARVARNLLRWFVTTPTLVCNPVGDRLEILAFVDREPYAVIQLTVEAGVVTRLHVIADPEQLAAGA